MAEPDRLQMVAEWWRGLSGSWRANVALYGLATIALIALVAQLAIGGGSSAQKVEVASRAPAKSTPSPPNVQTPTSVGPTTTGLPAAGPAAPAVPPGPTPTQPPAPPVPLSVDPFVPQDTTTVAPGPVCQNSTDPACGPLVWSPPVDNRPMNVSVQSFSPPSPKVGDIVTFTVRVTDPDIQVTDNCAEASYGDGSSIERRSCIHPPCSDAHGAWAPPPPVAGDQTFTFSHAYQQAGPVTATFTFHTDHNPPCPNPYGSAGSGQAFLTLQPAGP